MSKKNWALVFVFAAIILGIIVGRLVGTTASLFTITYYAAFDLLGSLFINALSLVVVPLVSCSIITGVAKMAKDHSFGRLGAKTFAFYISTSFLAVVIGVVFVNLIAPGKSVQVEAMSTAQHHEIVQKHMESLQGDNIRQLILEIIPSNVLWSFSKGQMLGLIFFSILFGFSLSKVQNAMGETVLNACQGIFQTMIEITHLVLKLLPFGVFCLVAKTFAVTGFDSLRGLLLFFITVLCGLFVFAGIVLPLLLRFVGGVNPIRHVRAMAPAILTAFSTSSSSATLPITIDCVEKRAKVSNKICSLVVPLGSSMNMSGSALYECVAALFVAQAYGLEVSMITQVVVVFLALLTSMGVAGIPAGSLVCVIVILQALGLPAEGIGLFLAVDRLLDMCRTTVNVFSDSCCAVLVATSEGEKEVLSVDNFD